MKVKLLSMFFLRHILSFFDQQPSKLSILDAVEQLIQTAGYKSEVYQAETADGYILKVHRILSNRTLDIPRLGPVFIMHGLFATCADFLISGPNIALPYLLSDNGYDVWLGNSRGSDYSLRHKTLTIADDEFWNYSFHDIGLYDLPAMIDLMLEKTGSTKAFYVGHSQGASNLLALLTMRPEYNRKIIQTHFVCPAAFMQNFPPQIVKFLPAEFELLLRGRLDLGSPVKLILKLCIQPGWEGLCVQLYLLVVGQNRNGLEVNPSRMPSIFENFAKFVSLKAFAHFFQLIKSGKFRQFDYRENNTAIYNARNPPSYNLKNFKAPTYIYSGGSDGFTSAADVAILSRVLPNVRRYQNFDNLNHGDTIYGENSRRLIFNHIVKAFDSGI